MTRRTVQPSQRMTGVTTQDMTRTQSAKDLEPVSKEQLQSLMEMYKLKIAD